VRMDHGCMSKVTNYFVNCNERLRFLLRNSSFAVRSFTAQ
jgi:hypothetical protein